MLANAGQITDRHIMLPDRCIPDLYDLYDLYDMYDLYDLACVAGWKPYNVRDLAHDSWIGCVLYRSPTPHNGRARSTKGVYRFFAKLFF